MKSSKLEHTKNQITRRQTLKAFTAGSAVAGIAGLPARWKKPLVDSIVLPAHAATTDDSGSAGGAQPTTTPVPDPCTVDCDVNVELSWNHSENTELRNVALEVLTPGGTRISPNGAQRGRCLEIKRHDGIVDDGITTIGNITAGKVAPGRYQLFYDLGPGSNYVSLNMYASACDSNSSGGVGTNDTGVGAFGSINISSGGTAVVRVQ